MLLFVVSCSSSGYKSGRPFERFEAPELSVDALLQSAKKTSDQKKKMKSEEQIVVQKAFEKKVTKVFQKKLESIDSHWYLKLHKKRKNFAKFQKDRKTKFSREQKTTRDNFVNDKPSREMLKTFLSEQGENQRAYYQGHQEEMDFFDENEKRLKKAFQNFKTKKQVEFDQKIKVFLKRNFKSVDAK